ncbi:TPA: alpha/beta hydrolase fold domain-containing protein [Pseudomonas aeruginosa]|nr:alpha/beta hydrolase fold domain-containing protein [Pseudomonas aeruginosa]HEP8853869.1 alpha/beta hydrolase fold domain-containing protein [Pseudomonas aeruginosa]
MSDKVLPNKLKVVPPPFDPELDVALNALSSKLPKFRNLNRIQRDRELSLSLDASDLTRGGSYRLEARKAPGLPGTPDIPLALFLPAEPSSFAPLFYYIHGGGTISGDSRSGVSSALEVASKFGAPLVSVEYRLAPETPYPGPVSDCYAGLLWAARCASELGGHPERIIVTGASAGGGLAAATCLLARDRDDGPHIAAQLLMYPMLDDRNDTVSAFQMEGLGVWDRISNNAGWTALLGEARGAKHVSQYAAPARSTDLSRLPPTFIDVGSAETFRDEVINYANKIWCAGGQCELHVWAGGFHGYDSFVPDAKISKDTINGRIRWLRRVLGC